jgi:hypothetical protein
MTFVPSLPPSHRNAPVIVLMGGGLMLFMVYYAFVIYDCLMTVLAVDVVGDVKSIICKSLIDSLWQEGKAVL